jgi:hypothetical protein
MRLHGFVRERIYVGLVTEDRSFTGNERHADTMVGFNFTSAQTQKYFFELIRTFTHTHAMSILTSKDVRGSTVHTQC